MSKVLPAKKWMLIVSVVGVLGLVAFSGFILFEATKAEVELTNDGEKQTIQTHANTVEGLLDEAEIAVHKHDDITPSMDTAIEDGMDIEHKTANQVIVTIDEDNETYYTTTDTVGEFLNDEDIQTGEHDELSLSKHAQITDGMQLDIDEGFEVTINDGGDKSKVGTVDTTVKDLLEEHNIDYDKDDVKVKPKLKKQVKEDDTIEVVYVDTKTDKEVESLAYDTVEEEDDSLKKGKEKVKTEGKKGKVEKEYEITKENGEEVDKELVNEKVKKESKDEVIAVGTKEPKSDSKKDSGGDIKTLSDSEEKSDDDSSNNSSDNDEKSKSKNDDGDESPSGDGEEFEMEATGYTASCDGCSGVTATGINLKDNPDKKVVAVDPDVIPLGSTVWVEGYGEAVAGDTGGAIKGNRIDIFVPDKEDTDDYNGSNVKVKIVDEK